jgi:hypothetical protein
LMTIHQRVNGNHAQVEMEDPFLHLGVQQTSNALGPEVSFS